MIELLRFSSLNLFFRNGTSMISLIIPPRDQIPRIAKMLADEYGTASNIKSRVNRLSVLSAITSVQARLKLYNKGMRSNFNLIGEILFLGFSAE